MLMVSSMVSLHFLGQDDINEVQHDIFDHMMPMAASMAHDTEPSTSSTGTRSHIISLNNHLNITNAKVWLMSPSASCDWKYVIAIYILKTYMLSNATYDNDVMCRYETTRSAYIPLSAIWPGVLVYMHYTLLAYAPEQKCLLHCIYISHCTSTIIYI